VKGCHNLSDTEYYESVNQIALQELFDGRGRELIEQLIHTTIKDQDEISIAETRLEDLKSIFSKLTRKHRFLR
jgi:transcriptional regulatory protein LevR